jgi:hypothetical protein
VGETVGNTWERVVGLAQWIKAHPESKLELKIEDENERSNYVCLCDPAKNEECPGRIKTFVENTSNQCGLDQGKLNSACAIKGWFFASLWMRYLTNDQLSAPLDGGLDGKSIPEWRAWAKVNGNITIAFDSMKKALPFVNATEGKPKIQVLLGQKYWGWGYDTIQHLFDKVVNKKTFTQYTDSGLDIICKDNVAKYELGWNTNNFSAKLPECSF